MKRSLLLSFIIISCSITSAQEVEPFHYKAIIRDTSGEIIISSPVSLRFSILPGGLSGNSAYSETHKVLTDPSGMISLAIGSGTEKRGNFQSISWDTETWFLRVELDPDGGSVYHDIGTTQIIAVPVKYLAEETKENQLNSGEDELFITRKYVGSFLDYRYTGPETYAGPNIIWIKTSMDNVYGKFSAYGKNCEFSSGDNLYVKRSYYSPGGIIGYWVYQIENDSSIFYRLTDFQHDKQVLVETLF